MAKVKISTKKVQVLIKDTFKEAINDQSYLEQQALFIRKRIQAFTRRGKSIVTNKSFPRLAKSSKEGRKRLAEINTVDEFFRPNKANLTFTGQLVDSLKERVKRRRLSKRATIIIEPKGEHFPIFSGKKLGKTIKNVDLAEWMAKGDSRRNRPPRPFIGLDDKGTDRIKRNTIKILRQKIGRRFRK